MGSEIYVHQHEPIDTINPNVYGHFAEHLGRCIYGGLWVGEDDRVPTEDGVRMDTVELLADLEMPVLRWPGGCFADDYHWEDGIGPREERPTRRNAFWTQGRADIPEEPNEFGTEEFMRVCDLLDTEPYLAANVGNGSPGEAADWLEYCNYDGDTELANRRAENGSEDPHDVKFWGVGNENWGCGGRLSPEEYAEQFRRYATYLRSVDGMLSERDVDLVSVGHINEDWNRKFLDALDDCAEFVQGPYDLMDHMSVHRYYEAGGDTDFDDEEYFRLLARSRKVGGDVDDAVDALSTYAPESDISIIVDEWGVWHPEATNTNGLEQENTVRDAISAAGVFDDLHERADVVSMANIAQTVNVLQCLVQTDEEDAWATPTYQVFDLYENHAGGTALDTVIETDEHEVEDEPYDVPLVSASASAHGDEVFVTLSNRALESEDVTVSLEDKSASLVDSEVLFADNAVEEYSTKDNADEFTPDDVDVVANGDGTFAVAVPESAVVGLTFEA
ncbi:Alpha-N-arabinofuranosidase 2 protein [Halorhabdus tiamatea SARL4B]|uniref:non-reducing end alpha-L-arabinofuranosidase n=1 Tax=Halorhabdus tiamatea SARL4B TaxID=1033806 RepID=F7PQL3_9EURY|nr:alpha-L-arabinofuranosidase C-terminal domain-containing protein [Halorhabdus tiamatea]ERJ05598.1 Alpha-N-arabinofuranosidase 2 protein [Halorhabdus tiamatea SARL4B]CCQ35009.1 alpha-L-arabinofuranosidase, family GH51 [Halorhabdus tiamatea SARL4B]